MEKPNIVISGPIRLELELGTYHWCTCGQSKNQPFCDKSHNNGTACEPLEFKVTEKRLRSYCCCKLTGDAPYCDGTHKTIQINGLAISKVVYKEKGVEK